MKYFNILTIFFIIFAAHAEEDLNRDWSQVDRDDRPTRDQNRKTMPLEEIIVTSSRTIVDRTVSKRILTKSEIDDFPLMDNDILRAVQTFPGVVGNDFSARFNVRGGEKDETLIFLDGMELYEPYHLQDFGGAISIIDLLAVSNAQLLPGGFPAEYGDKMSAVLDIKSIEPRNELDLNGGIDLLNAHLMVSKHPFFVSGRRGYIDLLMGMIETEENFSPKYSDLFAKVTHDFSPKNRLTANILFAGDTNKIDQEGIEDDVESEYNNRIAWAKWHSSNSSLRSRTPHLMDRCGGVQRQFSSELYLFGGYADQRRREGDDGKDDRDISYFGMKASGNAIAGAHTVKTGIEWRKMSGEYHYRDNVTDESELPIVVDAKLNGFDLKGFVSDEWKITPFLATNFGTRLIYQSSETLVLPPENDKLCVSPRISLAVMPFDGLTLRGAWGIYHQPVTAIELPVEDGVSKIEDAEKASHYLAGLQYENQELNLNVRLDAYYKKMDNLVGQIKDYGKKTQLLTPVDSAFSEGVELSIDQLFNEFFYSLGYTFSIAKEKSGGDEFYRDFDQRHTVGLGLGYNLSENTFAYVSWRFHTGNPYTKKWYEACAERRRGNGEFRYGDRNAERLPAFHSLDLRVSKRFHWKYDFKVYLQVLNVYNRQNVHEYSLVEKHVPSGGEVIENGKIEYERQEEHFLPFMPTLGLNVEF